MLLAQSRVREGCGERGVQKGRAGVATGYAGGRGGGKKKRWKGKGGGRTVIYVPLRGLTNRGEGVGFVADCQMHRSRGAGLI
jgi:hypothetical protein